MKRLIIYTILFFIALISYGQTMESEQISTNNYNSAPGTNLPVYYGHYNLMWNDVDWLYDNLGTAGRDSIYRDSLMFVTAVDTHKIKGNADSMAAYGIVMEINISH